MTTAPELIEHLTPPAAQHDARLEDWRTYLAGRIDPDWRTDEWDAALWLFTGDLDNPRTVSYRCWTPECPRVNAAANMRCRSCEKAFARRGLSVEEFDATYIPTTRLEAYKAPDQCAAGPENGRCQRRVSVRGLCRSHYSLWVATFKREKMEDSDRNLAIWAGTAQGYELRPPCSVLGCFTESSVSAGLCPTHYHRWMKSNAETRGAVETWASRQAPYLMGNQISLAPLLPTMRLEVLFALQQRDAASRKLDPRATRSIVSRVVNLPSLVLAPPGSVSPNMFGRTTSVIAHFHEMLRHLRLAFDHFNGIDPTERTVWDLSALGIGSATGIRARRNAGTADFAEIQQPWLQAVVMQWARSSNPTGSKLATRISACMVASKVLTLRPGGGMEPSELGFADMTAVVAAFRILLRKDGNPYSEKRRHTALSSFWQVLDFGRLAGMLDTLPALFGRHPEHRIALPEINEDEIGKAVPETVIAQLDRSQETLGDGIFNGSMTAEDVKVMCRTLYALMRDTGRRPNEIVSLEMGCLEKVDGHYNLIWDNNKGKRLRRRLPIDIESAGIIQKWQATRASLDGFAHGDGYLFPAATERKETAHLGSGFLSRMLRSWVDTLPHLDSETPGPDGGALPFERPLIFPYAFRFAFAQRCADAGIPLDILREFMDHKDPKTTLGYYKVSLNRKRAAVELVRKHAVDRGGRPAPMPSMAAYERSSVAAPFGGCAEPSNVKAGGKACPLRFRCAGCDFYRPDPSYLPVIEDHIRTLKAERETAEALDAAAWVTGNMNDEIDAYKRVAANMKRKMEELTADERAEIEEASKILRKTRAANGRTLFPLTVVQPNGETL
ncbi:site-specific integrase [Rhodococcus opacus]|nr:site-specific integrase [Rhodococcus opacus]MDT2010263.1 site-specific integrase [Rhodococcus opacus]